jgi:hypothetical protein
MLIVGSRAQREPEATLPPSDGILGSETPKVRCGSLPTFQTQPPFEGFTKENDDSPKKMTYASVAYLSRSLR